MKLFGIFEFKRLKSPHGLILSTILQSTVFDLEDQP